MTTTPSTSAALRLIDERAVNVQTFIVKARDAGDRVELAQWEGVASELRFLRLELTDPTPRTDADDDWNVVCAAEPTA